MVETSKWSEQEFRTTVIDMLKALMEKMDNVQDHKQRNGDSKKESKGNDGNQKYYNRNEECLWWAHK